MDNKMIEVKENFWDRLKKFFKRVILREKVDLTTEEEKNVEDIEAAYKKGKVIEEHKIENIENVMDKNLRHEVEEPEPIVEVEYTGKYKKTMVNGREIRCQEKDEDGIYTKRYIVPGEKEAVYTRAEGVDTKKFIIYGYRETQTGIREMSFTERVRDKRLDIELSEITKQGVTEIIKKGPLLDLDDQYKGSSERREVTEANGNRLIEEDKQIIDEQGNIQSIRETHQHIGNNYVYTKYLNGQAVFQLVRDEKGTVIKEFDEHGNVKDAYKYDKDGKPTETVNVIDENGRIVRKAKTYAGIPEIPDDKMEPNSYGRPDLSKQYSQYLDVIGRAGYPPNIANILDEAIPEYHIPQRKIEDFEKAREQLKAQEQLKTQVKQRTGSLER